MKTLLKTKYLIPIGCIAVGTLFAVLSATQYELWHAVKGPMSGFLPFICSVMLALTGIAGFFQAKNDEEPVYQKDNWLLVACVLAVMGANYIIGFLPSLFIFIFGWLKIKEKCSWKVTILTLICLIVMIVGIFQLWLDIPFEKGLLFNSLFA